MSFSNNPFIPEPQQIRKPRADEALIFLDFDGVVHPRPSAALPTAWREVESYLDEFQASADYAIIDDKSHNFGENVPRLFLTDPLECLTEQIADEIIRSFTGQE